MKAQGAITQQQLEAAVWLCGYIREEVKRLYNHTILFDRRYLVGHNEITPKTRPNCPGQKFPWDGFMARLGNKPLSDVLYRVQVGAFGVRDNADTFLKETVLPKDVEAFVVEGKDTGNKPLYRVQVGAFDVRSNGENYLATVQEKGLEAFLVVEEK